MKIKDGYILNEISGTKVAVYIGENDDGLRGVVKLNSLGVFLWEKLTAGCTMEELVKTVTDKYDVDEQTAARDAEAFVRSLREEKILVD